MPTAWAHSGPTKPIRIVVPSAAGSAPAGKPPAVVGALEQALQKIMREPEVVGTMESRGAEIGFFASHGHGHVHGGECEKMETRRQFCKNYPGLKE